MCFSVFSFRSKYFKISFVISSLDSQTQETQPTPKTRNLKKTIPRPIISRWLKIWKAAIEKKHIFTFRGPKIMMTTRRFLVGQNMNQKTERPGHWGPKGPLPRPQPQLCFALGKLSYELSPAKSSTSTTQRSFHLSVGEQVIYYPNWEAFES